MRAGEPLVERPWDSYLHVLELQHEGKGHSVALEHLRGDWYRYPIRKTELLSLPASTEICISGKEDGKPDPFLSQ